MSPRNTALLLPVLACALADAPVEIANAAEEASPPPACANRCRALFAASPLGPDGIEWKTFEVIRAAVAAVERQHRVHGCRIGLGDGGADELVVSFGNARSEGGGWGWRGCPPGPCECLVVTLSKADLHVLRLSGIR
jgi:hypothetical protein